MDKPQYTLKELAGLLKERAHYVEDNDLYNELVADRTLSDMIDLLRLGMDSDNEDINILSGTVFVLANLYMDTVLSEDPLEFLKGVRPAVTATIAIGASHVVSLVLDEDED